MSDPPGFVGGNARADVPIDRLARYHFIVDQPLIVALCLALPLAALGVWSIGSQLRGMRQLAARTHVPLDERHYLRGRHRRRLACGLIMTAVATMIATAYLSGMEAKASAGRAAFNQVPVAEGGAQATPEEKQFFRFWSVYWIVVVSLLGVLVLIASADAWATRRYGLKILRELRDEHKARLARDLAVFKQQKNDRFGNRFAGGGPA